MMCTEVMKSDPTDEMHKLFSSRKYECLGTIIFAETGDLEINVSPMQVKYEKRME
jgi:hypothetical protein